MLSIPDPNSFVYMLARLKCRHKEKEKILRENIFNEIKFHKLRYLGGASASSAKSASGPSDISDTDLPSASSQSEAELEGNEEVDLAELEKKQAELQARKMKLRSNLLNSRFQISHLFEL